MSDYAHLLESLRGGGLTIAQSAVPVPHTGTTVATVLATIVVPAGMMGSNGSVEIEAYWANDNTANDKTLALSLNGGGADVAIASVATTGVAHITRWVVMNKNATNAQHIYREEQSAAAVVPAAVTDTEDTTAALTLTILGQLEVGSETMTLLSYTARATQR